MYGFSDHLNAIPRTRLRAERHGSSRYSTGMSEILEHTFERITFALPSGPKHVHCWVIEGDRGRMLVDAGMGLPGDEESFRGLEVDAIVLTHMHPDHVGGAQRAGAPLAAGPRQRPHPAPPRRRARLRRRPAVTHQPGGRALPGEPSRSARRLPADARADRRARPADRVLRTRRSRRAARRAG